MSIVGTRPPLIGEVSEYELHHRARLAIKPGITGMWQVSGRSDITDFEEVVELDKEYIENWNIPWTFAKARKKYMNLTHICYDAKGIEKLGLDYIIVGSDEVWNYRER